MNKLSSDVKLTLESIIEGKLDLEIAYAYSKFGSMVITTVEEWAWWMSTLSKNGKTEKQFLSEFNNYKQMIINCPDEFLRNLRHGMGYMIYKG